MKKQKSVLLSKCCNYKVFIVPPSFGEPSFYVCDKCYKSTSTERKIIQTHIEINRGHFRPIDNSKIGY